MEYYKITIYDNSNIKVANYFKWADSCNEAMQKVLSVIILLDGDAIKIEKI